jgi:putative transcriptional regulator
MKLRLKDLRKTRGWTQEHLADLLGTAKGHISGVESGKKNPSAALMERMARVFEVRLVDLIDAGDMADDLYQLIDIMQHLSDDERKFILRSAAGLRSQQH